MIELVEILKRPDDNHSETSEVHLLKVEIFDYEAAEVVPRDFKEQSVGGYCISGEHHHQYLRIGLVERKVDSGFFAGGGVVGQAYIPQHSAHIGAAAGVQLTPGGHTFEPRRGYGRNVRIGIAFEHRAQRGVELFGVVLGDVCQGIQEHKFRHELAHGEFVGHTLITAVYSLVVVGHISVVGVFVDFFLDGVHLSQVVDIVGITQSFAVLTIPEAVHYHLTVALGHTVVAGAHKHQVDIVVRLQTIYVVRIVHKQTIKFLHGCVKVIEFVLEDDAHIEQAFLYDFMRHGLVGITEGYLLEVVLAVMRIFGFFLLLLIFGRYGVHDVLGRRLFAVFIRGAAAVKIAHSEGGLIATAPIVFKLTCTPTALKFGFTGITRGRIVKVPTVIRIQRIGLRRRRLSHIRVIAGLLLGLEFLATCSLGFFFFFFHQLGNDAVKDGITIVLAHSRQAKQAVLKVDILAVYGQLVQHIGTALDGVQSGEVVRQLGYGLGVARLCQFVLMLLVIQPAEFHLRQGLVYAVARGFLGRQDIIGRGTHGVAAT